MLRNFASTCVLVGVLATGVTNAMAQTTPDPHHPRAAGIMDRMMDSGPADMMARFQTARGIAFLRAEPGSTDPQKAGLRCRRGSDQEEPAEQADMEKLMATMMDAKNPLERIDARIAVMDKRTQALKEIKLALAALYASLRTEQKAKADQILTGIGCNRYAFATRHDSKTFAKQGQRS